MNDNLELKYAPKHDPLLIINNSNECERAALYALSNEIKQKTIEFILADAAHIKSSMIVAATLCATGNYDEFDATIAIIEENISTYITKWKKIKDKKIAREKINNTVHKEGKC